MKRIAPPIAPAHQPASLPARGSWLDRAAATPTASVVASAASKNQLFGLEPVVHPAPPVRGGFRPVRRRRRSCRRRLHRGGPRGRAAVSAGSEREPSPRTRRRPPRNSRSAMIPRTPCWRRARIARSEKPIAGVEEQAGDGQDCRRNDDPDSLGRRARPRRRQQRRSGAAQGEPEAPPKAGYAVEFRKHRFPPIPPLFRQRSGRERENPQGEVAATRPLDEDQAAPPHRTRRSRRSRPPGARARETTRAAPRPIHTPTQTHAHGTLGRCLGRRGVARVAAGSWAANASPAAVRR